MINTVTVEQASERRPRQQPEAAELEERKWHSGYPGQLIKVALLDSIFSLAMLLPQAPIAAVCS